MKPHPSPMLFALLIGFASTSAYAQDPQNPGPGRFVLGGTARLVPDPENPANDVIRIRTDIAPFFGTVSRRANVKIERLDNMLEFKGWFDPGDGANRLPNSCTGGSPRLQISIDLDGDGDPDGNAFGYFGPPPEFTLCPMETWLSEDLTGAGDIAITGLPLFPSTGRTTPNEELEWDLTQFGGAFYNTWSQVEDFFASHPRHLACSIALVDDTFDIPFMTGTAYYDIFSAGRATFADRNDVARGFARGCQERDHDDDLHEGDRDHDHDEDVADAAFDRDRRLRAKGGS